MEYNVIKKVGKGSGVLQSLTFEAFEGRDIIQPREFHEYRLRAKGEVKDKYSALGKVKYALHSNNSFKPVFLKNNKLYTLEKMDNLPETDEFRIEYVQNKVLSMEEHCDVYGKVVEFYINQRLKVKKLNDKYPKYRAKNNDTILGNFILTRDGQEQVIKSKNGFQLKRKFRINPSVNKVGRVILYINCSSDFSYNKSIYEMQNDGMDITGLRVKNNWGNISGTGIIKGVMDFKISEEQEFGGSLVDYYINKNQGYRVKNFTEEDLAAKAVKVCHGKKSYNYIPHALTPVITREYISRNDGEFSKRIENLIKNDIAYRYKILKKFVGDIGEIQELNNLSFKDDYVESVRGLGYEIGELKEPVLKGKSGTIKSKNQIFKNGFIKEPEEDVRFGVLYPEGHEEETRAVIRAIYDFSRDGKYQKVENKYIRKSLMNIKYDSKDCIFESYKLGDITEYKKAALMLKNKENIGFVIAVIPSEDSGDSENPYSPFKKTWSELNIPSQMISLKTASRFMRSTSISELYFLHNIALGILGKIGGIPWVIDNMQGDVDCFIGLDVGTKEKGIHFPACSVVFDKNGRLINYYKPTVPQSGEKIGSYILQEIFDKVLLSYEEAKGHYPRNIVIHRDGFSREDPQWYIDYFDKKGIEFNIIEVRKNTRMKLAAIDNGKKVNPKVGSYVLKKDKALIISTDIGEKFGSPNPLKIEKTHGKLDMKTIINQIYALSHMHVGSTKSTRLPITTGYADKLCKAVEYIPAGQVDNRLFFL